MANHLRAHPSLILTGIPLLLLLVALSQQQSAWTPPPLYQKELCKGLTIAKNTPQTPVNRTNQSDTGVKVFLVWDRQKIPITSDDGQRLMAAQEKLDIRLPAIFKVDWVPTDLRFPRWKRPSSDPCDKKICGNEFAISKSFLQPCRHIKGGTIPVDDLIPATADNDNLVNQAQMERRSFTIWIEVNASWCNGAQPAYMVPEQAGAYICGFDETTKRPTHGLIVLCVEPRHYDVDELYVVLLHNIMHIMLGPVSGSYFPRTRDRSATASSTDRKGHYQSVANGVTFIPRTQNFQTKQMYWEPTNFSVLTAMTTTASVLAHVQEYFNCTTLPGAEWATKRVGDQLFNWDVDEDHWSTRLFPDEILSPLLIPYKNISFLTLALAEDSGWYRIEWAEYEELSTRPHPAYGCKVATQSEGQLLDKVRWADTLEEKMQVTDYGPYCDHWGPVTTDMCTVDGQAIQRCWAMASTHFSDVRYSAKYHFDFTYKLELDTPFCKKMKSYPKEFTDAGFRVGPNTMCVTVTEAPNIPPSVNLQVFLMPLCIEYECAADSLILKLRLPNNVDCSETCTKGAKVGKDRLKTFNGCSHNVTILCPNVGKVCHGEKTVTRGNRTTRGRGDGSADGVTRNTGRMEVVIIGYVLYGSLSR